ncbi:MAG: cyclic 2,3-diphosphoglycerate-synthetase [Thermoleophilia bacterium]|nr:cyclic 2,3-diphosphoglycerate-synthetase [Thermoleophilia bacterium]
MGEGVGFHAAGAYRLASGYGLRMTAARSELPVSLRAPTGEGVSRRCVVLVDGEHYPTAVADAIADLVADGWDVAAAGLVGGGEKLRGEPEYGVPHAPPPPGDPTPAGALRAALVLAGPAVAHVIDLADEPVLVLERRLELVGIAAARGLRYVTADTVVEPPTFERIDVPIMQVIGTGKRIGKTAASAHAARVVDAHLGGEGRVVVVAMGRGGPAEPIVVDRAGGPVTIERLLEISRAGSHAASDYLEDAALTGLTTVGCRRVSGGLLGVPARSNVPDGVRLAADLEPPLVLLEGSGSCVPPVRANSTLLLASTERPQDLLGGLGPYRLGLADVLLVMGDDREVGRELCAVAVAHPAWNGRIALAASLVPTPVDSVDGLRVAAFTTAPDFVAPIVERELAGRGADVALVSCNLARRDVLAQDLERAVEAGATTLVVEIKAAAIDAVAEFADARGLDVIFLDNVPRPHDPGLDLDDILRELADAAIERAGSD